MTEASRSRSLETAAEPVASFESEASLGASQIMPSEVATNRRRVLLLCAVPAALPALIIGAVLGVVVSWIVGVVTVVVVALAIGYGVWRIAPGVALHSIGARRVDAADYPGLANVTEGLCATFGLRMPALHVVSDPVPNSCALGRDTQSSELVVTSGLLAVADPIVLEGVVAHELAHVKRGDNGVSCIGITLARLLGGEATLRRCLGERPARTGRWTTGREYRADIVGASAVRYPRGLLDALRLMMAAPPPLPDSVFAPPRYGTTRWVWIDPSVGHRDDPVAPGDLDATSVRAAALSEW